MNRAKGKKFRKRVAEVLREELEVPEHWIYLSFAEDVPDGFRGAVFIKAHGLADAVTKCNVLQINPGGQIVEIPIPPHAECNLPPECDRNRLLSKEDLLRLWPETKTLREWEEDAERDAKAQNTGDAAL